MNNLFNFLYLLNKQATELQWSNNVGIVMTPKDVLDANTDSVNLLKNQGEVNLEMIKKFKRQILERN